MILNMKKYIVEINNSSDGTKQLQYMTADDIIDFVNRQQSIDQWIYISAIYELGSQVPLGEIIKNKPIVIIIPFEKEVKLKANHQFNIADHNPMRALGRDVGETDHAFEPFYKITVNSDELQWMPWLRQFKHFIMK